MPPSTTDRLVMFFVLEIGWLLGVLQLADTPLLADAGSRVVALVLCLGASSLAAAFIATFFSPSVVDATTLCRGVGVVLFASGLYACIATTTVGPGSVMLVCLGLILAVTGMRRRRVMTPGP